MEPELERIEFEGFQKIPRLNKDMVITEKIDGSNGCIIIQPTETTVTDPADPTDSYWNLPIARVEKDGVEYGFWAQSRKRMITPADTGGKGADNMGFAAYVRDHASQLVYLGAGRHFGEWWGQGIQRTYGLEEKRFSLFNGLRYAAQLEGGVLPDNVHAVPILRTYGFSTNVVTSVMEQLREGGSVAAPGFPDAEGIVVYHTAARKMFKVTFDYDKGKWSAEA